MEIVLQVDARFCFAFKSFFFFIEKILCWVVFGQLDINRNHLSRWYLNLENASISLLVGKSVGHFTDALHQFLIVD